jgi:monothiol glutaredoxin
MKPRKIRLFIKPGCPWCIDAVEWFDARGWSYERLDVTRDEAARQEMLDLTGQTKAPSAEIDGHVLPDFDTGQLERFLAKLGYQVE